jgi:Putative addiction module component
VAPDAEKLVSEALKLPAEERVELVDRLLKSLDDEEGDALEDEDRERLHAAIGRSEEQFLAGQAVPAKVVLDALRKKR